MVFANLSFLLVLLVFTCLLAPTIAFPLLQRLTFAKQWQSFLHFTILFFTFIILVVEFQVAKGRPALENDYNTPLQFAIYLCSFMTGSIVRQLSRSSMMGRQYSSKASTTSLSGTTVLRDWEENNELYGLLTTNDGSSPEYSSSTSRITMQRETEEDSIINKDSSKQCFPDLVFRICSGPNWSDLVLCRNNYRIK
jgi:hypothetical protein